MDVDGEGAVHSLQSATWHNTVDIVVWQLQCCVTCVTPHISLLSLWGGGRDIQYSITLWTTARGGKKLHSEMSRWVVHLTETRRCDSWNTHSYLRDITRALCFSVIPKPMQIFPKNKMKIAGAIRHQRPTVLSLKSLVWLLRKQSRRHKNTKRVSVSWGCISAVLNVCLTSTRLRHLTRQLVNQLHGVVGDTGSTRHGLAPDCWTAPSLRLMFYPIGLSIPSSHAQPGHKGFTVAWAEYLLRLR